MRPPWRRSPEVASIRRRAAAASIDGLVLLVVLGVAADVGWLIRQLRRRRGARDASERGWLDREWPDFTTARWRVGFAAWGLASTVALRNWRGPGRRLLGLRAVDARTGGPVDVATAIRLWAAETAWRRAGRWAMRPWQRRQAAESERMSAQLEDIHRRYPDDAHARERAREELSQQDPTACCWWPLLQIVAAELVPIQLSERNQTLPERIAGVVVVREH